jgi:hypothetical protein
MEKGKRCAIELVEKMRLSSLKITKKDAKVCALIAVDEVIFSNHIEYSNMQYWNEVKTEIEKL